MVKTISVKELRTTFPDVRKNLAKGFRYIIIYRSSVIGELKPLGRDEICKRKKNCQNLKNSGLSFFANPPKSSRFKSRKSASKLIRQDRD